jgi:hypothetical protein
MFKNFGFMALWAILFVGCRAEEQGRVLYYEPGIYKGKSFSALSKEQKRQLKQRTAQQGSDMVSISGGGMKKSNVRKPEGSTDNSQQLKNRALLQSGSGTN